jgi:hypothetical protein
MIKPFKGPITIMTGIIPISKIRTIINSIISREAFMRGICRVNPWETLGVAIVAMPNIKMPNSQDIVPYTRVISCMKQTMPDPHFKQPIQEVFYISIP